MSAPTKVTLDRYTEIGAISLTVRQAVKRLIVPLSVVLAATSLYLAFAGRTGAVAFALMSAGTCAALGVWASKAIGLPLLPMFAAQNLLIYGIPILAGHESILEYPAEYVLRGGVEVLIFDLSIAMSWAIGMRMLQPARPVSYALHQINKDGIKGWRKMGFFMILTATAYQLLAGFDLLDSLYEMIPDGGESVISTLISVMTACGFFLVSMVIGGTEAPVMEKVLFWGLLLANCAMSASTFLLAGTAAYLISVSVGLFWSSGKLPWRYLTVSLLALGFLNVGKTTMRHRHWSAYEVVNRKVPISEFPACFAEWSIVSTNALLENKENEKLNTGDADVQTDKNQTLLDRIDNLQNLLFVMDAMDNEHVRPLDGATYSLIPPLLVPRILWPDKPRSHEGQVLLNVHFGRQDLDSTLTTYIAWGLLPEAYGNFGPYAGSIALGAFLGVFFAWVENQTARKLLVSAEGFISLSLFMNLMNSFEMVASVLVTSTFQSFVIIVAASAPFVRRMSNPRPESAEP
jgi:hypothetical protein